MRALRVAQAHLAQVGQSPEQARFSWALAQRQALEAQRKQLRRVLDAGEVQP